MKAIDLISTDLVSSRDIAVYLGATHSNVLFALDQLKQNKDKRMTNELINEHTFIEKYEQMKDAGTAYRVIYLAKKVAIAYLIVRSKPFALEIVPLLLEGKL